MIFATDSTSQNTFSGASGVVLGANDELDPCDEVLIDEYETAIENGGTGLGPLLTGSVTLISMGSVSFASKLSAYGLEIIAADSVHFASEAQGSNTHIGTSVSAGGSISVTHDHIFYGCEGQTVSVFDPIMSWALVL